MSCESWSHETPPVAVLNCPQPDTTVCTVAGRIDPDTTPALQNVLDAAVRDENPHLVIDLSAVTFLGTTGLHTLFATSHQHDVDCGGHLAAVVDVNSQAFPRFYVAALEMMFDLHDDLAGALHACATAGTDKPVGLRHRPRMRMMGSGRLG